MDDPGTKAATITLDQLAKATATAVDTLRRWQALGLLSSGRDTVSFEDAERVRVLQFAQRRGIAPETVARACAVQGDLLGEYVESVLGFGGREPGPSVSLAEAAAASGLDPGVLHRLWVAAGLWDEQQAHADDLEALRRLRAALDAGLPEDAVVQIVRVFADALGRVADAEVGLFHHYVHERLRGQGLAGPELTAATQAISRSVVGLVEPTVEYFHRTAFRRALREDLLLHLADDNAPPTQVPGEIEATILFVDLSGFTPLTQAMGDDAAARLVARFSDLVREAARRHHGRVVKQIGDEFMLAFPDPGAAVSFGLEIEAATSAQPKFPAIRVGAHHGSVLYREGDYVGATVNVASRIVGRAGRHQFLITDTVRSAVADTPGVDVVPSGAHGFKGIPDQLQLYEVRRPGEQPARTIDPVCLMEVNPAAAAARLTWRGRELRFCSDDCLALFVAAPDRYPPSRR